MPSPLTPPLSAFINRRELDHHTEAQLRAACTAVVKGEVIQESVLTIYRPAHSKSTPHLTKHIGPEAHRPRTSKPADPDAPALPVGESRVLPNSRSVQDFRQPASLPKLQTALGTRVAQSSNPSSQPATASSLRTSNTFSPTTVYRKPVPIEESDGSYATPRTASTDRYNDTMSTGFTSTAITPSQPLGRVSGQTLPDHSKPKSGLRDSIEQSGSVSHQQRGRHEQTPIKNDPAPRPSSRSRFRDWAFHRPSSRGSMRPNTAVKKPELRRATSNERMNGRSARSSGGNGHAGFTLHERLSQINLRRSLSRGSTRPSIEGTHFDVDRSTPDLDLNRPLPRLPALDTWDKQNKAENMHSELTSISSTVPTMHVVDLMKATTVRSPPASAPVHIQQLAKEITILPSRDSNKEYGVRNTIGRMSANHSRSTSTADSCFSPTIYSRAPSTSLSHDRVRSPTAAHHSRGISDAPSTAYSNGSRPSLSRSGAVSSISDSVPNFSRKISLDSHGGIRSAEVTALPPMPPAVKPKGLRKMLSSIQVHVHVGGRKKNDVNWMEKFEKEGIKTGVMLPRGNGAAAAPIVRY